MARCFQDVSLSACAGSNGEFAGTSIEVNAHKTKEFAWAVRHFGFDYAHASYLADSEFDLPGMEFLYRQGGECLVYDGSGERHSVSFPSYVRSFMSLDELGNYFRARQ